MSTHEHQIQICREHLISLPTIKSRREDSLGKYIQENVSLPTLLHFCHRGMNMAKSSTIRRYKRYDYLYPVFWQFCFHGQHLSSIYIRIVGLIEGLFQLLQLIGCEDCPEGSKTLWSKHKKQQRWRIREKDTENSETWVTSDYIAFPHLLCFYALKGQVPGWKENQKMLEDSILNSYKSPSFSGTCLWRRYLPSSEHLQWWQLISETAASSEDHHTEMKQHLLSALSGEVLSPFPGWSLASSNSTSK